MIDLKAIVFLFIHVTNVAYMQANVNYNNKKQNERNFSFNPESLRFHPVKLVLSEMFQQKCEFEWEPLNLNDAIKVSAVDMLSSYHLPIHIEII